MRRHIVFLAAVLAVIAPHRRVSATQTVQVKMNGYDHTISMPDGWRAQPDAGGVLIRPPAGRAPSVELVIYGVPRPRGGDAFSAVRDLAKDAQRKKPYLTGTDPDPRKFVGQDGALLTLEGYPPGNAPREGVVFVTAVTADTLYVFHGAGLYDDIMAVVSELVQILEGVSTGTKGQATAVPKRTWVDDPPLQEPKRSGNLVDDATVGLKIEALPGWGMATAHFGYVLEKRYQDKKRVLVTMYLGDAEFQGKGDEYVKKVAGNARTRWDRFDEHEALVIERPAEFEGAGDAYELHVVRKGRPLIVYFRVDGTKLTDGDVKRARLELDMAVNVLESAEPKGTVVLGGGVAKVTLGKKWTLKQYGPGASALLGNADGVTAQVFVYTSTYYSPNLTCDHNGEKPAEKAVKIGRKKAKSYTCANDARDQLLYAVPSGEYTVYVLFSDEKARKPEKAAAEFLKLLKL